MSSEETTTGEPGDLNLTEEQSKWLASLIGDCLEKTHCQDDIQNIAAPMMVDRLLAADGEAWVKKFIYNALIGGVSVFLMNCMEQYLEEVGEGSPNIIVVNR